MRIASNTKYSYSSSMAKDYIDGRSFANDQNLNLGILGAANAFVKRTQSTGDNQRRSDMYRNKKDIIRMYSFDSGNYLETFPAGGTGTISRWDSKVIITPIPYGQMLQSPNTVQNPY